jgi:hypothetical protein
MSYNAWLYAYSNPANWLDPGGMKPVCAMLPPEDREACEQVVRGAWSSSSGYVGQPADLPICDPNLTRFGEPCIPIADCFPDDYFHPLDRPSGHPFSYSPETSKGFGVWFHYLLRKVPGWWNRNGKAPEAEILENLIALTVAAEINAEQHTTNTGIIYMAEAFARKAWSGEGQGFYGFIGGRESVRKTRLLPILYNRNPVKDDDPNNDWLWTKSQADQFKAFIEMDLLADPKRIRYNLALPYAINILYTPSWHRKDNNRPWDWGNIVDANPAWFKSWINQNAPQLSQSQAPLNNDPRAAIWFRYPQNPASAQSNDTLYVLTYLQQRALCGSYGENNPGNGCVGLTNAHSRPDFAP